MLDFKPETAAQHSDRILKVFDNLITPEMIENMEDPVWLKHEHVFDSTDGIRIIIGYEDHSDGRMLGKYITERGYFLHTAMSVDPLYDGCMNHLDELSDFYGVCNSEKCADLMQDRVSDMLLKHNTMISRLVFSTSTDLAKTTHALFELS